MFNEQLLFTDRWCHRKKHGETYKKEMKRVNSSRTYIAEHESAMIGNDTEYFIYQVILLQLGLPLTSGFLLEYSLILFYLFYLFNMKFVHEVHTYDKEK